MQKLTIRDIAEKANVSKSTVSRALNNSGYVSEEVRERIQQVVDAYSFTPSAIARGLSSRQSKMVGVVVPSMQSEFFSAVLEGINNEADLQNYTILICTTNDDPQRELHILNNLRGQQICGLIITPAAAYLAAEGWSALTREIDALNVPVVLMDRSSPKSNWDSICFDNYNGAYLIAETMLESGYQHIGAIIGDTSLQLGLDRYHGFIQCLEDHAHQKDAQYMHIDKGIISQEKAYHLTKEMIRTKKMPECIFLSNGLIADGFLRAAFEAGIKPGLDVQCMGFEQNHVLDILNIHYSYLDRETTQMGQMALDMLLERFEKDITSRREYVIPAKLNASRGIPKSEESRAVSAKQEKSK